METTSLMITESLMDGGSFGQIFVNLRESLDERVRVKETLKHNTNSLYDLIFRFSDEEIKDILELVFTKQRLRERIDFLDNSLGFCLEHRANIGDKENRHRRFRFWRMVIKSCLLPLTAMWRDELGKEYIPPTKAVAAKKTESVSPENKPCYEEIPEKPMQNIRNSNLKSREEPMESNCCDISVESPTCTESLPLPPPSPPENDDKVEYMEIEIPEHIKRQYKKLAQKRHIEREYQKEQFKKLQKNSNADFPKSPLPITSQDGEFQVDGAGQVLLGSFLTRLFANLELLENKKFISGKAQHRAVAIIQYLVNGDIHPQRTIPVMSNLMCGLPAETPCAENLQLTEKEKTEVEKLLESAINLWDKLGACSMNGFRQKFLQREGTLRDESTKLIVKVENKTIDILLNMLPFGWGYKRHQFPWLDKPIIVEWN